MVWLLGKFCLQLKSNGTDNPSYYNFFYGAKNYFCCCNSNNDNDHDNDNVNNNNNNRL